MYAHVIPAFIFAISTLSLHADTHEAHTKKPSRIILTSKVLKYIDGVKGAMDEYQIRNVMYIGRELNKMQFGIPDKKKPSVRIGMFSHKGRTYTIKDMARLEREYLKQHPHENPMDNKDLKELFERASIQLRDTVKPYLQDARRFKRFTIELIREYCEKTKNPRSHLLNWEKGNDEHELFLKYIKTHKDLNDFCTELSDFMAAMIYSCPKGFGKYLTWKKQQMKKSYDTKQSS
jgi:hypothetical protein